MVIRFFMNQNNALQSSTLRRWQVFNEMVEARDYQEARQVALAHNPNKIVELLLYSNGFLKPHVERPGILDPKPGDPHG